MTVEEFWTETENILNSYSKSDDPDFCGFFIGELDEVFQKWEDNDVDRWYDTISKARK